jgi:hypothetical protein
LSSCDWYTLLKLIPSNKLQIVLSDPVLDTLFPNDLKHKYRYAREQLSRHHIPASGQNPFGPIQPSPIFHRVDSWRNILSNKLCALSRLEVKDIVDIVFIAKNYAFDWETILYEAKEKDLWVEPIDVCRTIRQFPTDLLSTIKWIGNIDLEELKQHIDVVHDEIFTGVANSLFTSDSSLA